MGLFHTSGSHGPGEQLLEPDSHAPNDDGADVALVGVFDDSFRNLPMRNGVVVDAFREVRVQEVVPLSSRAWVGAILLLASPER